MAPASHLQSFDAVHVRLRDMSKTQSSNVDGRCDGEEISLRDQRVGTSHSDIVICEEPNALIFVYEVVEKPIVA